MPSGRTDFFRHIVEAKEFERLCSDLLEAEGFHIESEPSVDRTGVDFVAIEEYRSHASGDVILVRWKVQCKHYSKQNLGRGELERILWAFDAGRREGDGLLVMLSSDYSEEAKRVAADFMTSRLGTRVGIWNQRQMYARLEKHPDVLRRYGGGPLFSPFMEVFSDLRLPIPRRVLIISDQSALAHNFVAAFRYAAWEITFVPVWNYRDPTRARLFLSGADQVNYDLAIVFLGDSFGFPFSVAVQNILVEVARGGTPFILFPFLAWSRHRGLLPVMSEICPVRLLDPLEAESTFAVTLAQGAERLGDFGFLLGLDSFAEGRYSEYDPNECSSNLADGIREPFGLMHSFEFVIEEPDASVLWRDRSGNPFVVTAERAGTRICYLNTCCHSCMSSVPLTSPLEVSVDFARLVRNCMRWLLQENSDSGGSAYNTSAAPDANRASRSRRR